MTKDCLGKWFLQTTPDKALWYADIDLLRGINYVTLQKQVDTSPIISPEYDSLLLWLNLNHPRVTPFLPRNWVKANTANIYLQTQAYRRE